MGLDSVAGMVLGLLPWSKQRTCGWAACGKIHDELRNGTPLQSWSPEGKGCVSVMV